MEGYLHKKGGLTWKKRFFVLPSPPLWDSATVPVVPLNINYYLKEGDSELRGTLELKSSTRVTDLPNKAFGFQIVTDKKALVVYAENDDGRDRWKAALKSVLDGLTSAERAEKDGKDRPARAGFHTFACGGSNFEMEDKYELVKAVGNGAYGVVISVNDLSTGKMLAVKKIPDAFEDLIDAKRIVREIRLLRHFNHDNIIRIVDLPVPPSISQFDDVYIVTDLMETDLHKVIYSRQPLSNEHSQYFLYQMLCALKYLHSTSVLHRDLKPSNILLNANCDLKLCDFGLSRGLNAEREANNHLTEYVVTRWYRAPEIMLSCQEYSKAIDVWSLGCIYGEMLARKPMFPGNDYIHQLKLIVAFVGTPTAEGLWFVSNDKAKRFMLGLPRCPTADVAAMFPEADKGARDLLVKMLSLDPSARITVEEALDDEYFVNIRDVSMETVADKEIDWGAIEEVELTKLNLQKIILDDIKVYHPTEAGHFK